MLRVSMLIVGDVACGLIRFCHFQIDVTIPFTKLHILFEGDKTLREKKVALHGANTGFVGCGATMWGLFRRRVGAFQTGEGVGVTGGVAVGNVLLQAAGLPVAVLLGEILTVEKYILIGNFFCKITDCKFPFKFFSNSLAF